MKIIEDGVLYDYQFNQFRAVKTRLSKQKPKNIKPSKKKKVKKRLSKGQKWWRSLTLVEQADWRYNLMLKKKGKADWQFEYEQCRKENHYKKQRKLS